MNTKRPFLFVMCIILFINCGKENEGFILNGKIDGDYNGLIYLRYNDLIDSTIVVKNSFAFKGNVPNPTKGILYPGRPSSKENMTLGIFMLENSSIKTFSKYSVRNSNMGMTKFLDIDSISGSKSQNLRNHFEDKMIKTVYNEKIDSLKGLSLYNNLHEFISNNPKSVMSGEYLADLGSNFNYLNEKQFEALLKLMDTTYQAKGDMAKISALIKQSKLFAIGNRPPDIILPNQEGIIIDRLSLNGKIVLLEFWASWCAPCRQTNPELVDVYNSYKDEGFEILGISIDKNKDDWQTAINEDGLSWTQVLDSLRTTQLTYNLNSIPFNLLLDKDGEIIAQNIKPIELIPILKKKL